MKTGGKKCGVFFLEATRAGPVPSREANKEDTNEHTHLITVFLGLLTKYRKTYQQDKATKAQSRQTDG